MPLRAAHALGRNLYAKVNPWSGIPSVEGTKFGTSARLKGYGDSASQTVNKLRYLAAGLWHLPGQQVPHPKRALPRDPKELAQSLLVQALFQGIFMFYYAATDWRTQGVEHLYAGMREAQRRNAGLIIAMEHDCLLNDPFDLMGLTKTFWLTTRNKRWLSTPCGANFFPKGNDILSRTVRMFSNSVGMIPMWRRKKYGNSQPPTPNNVWEFLQESLSERALKTIRGKAAAKGLPVEQYVMRYKVPVEAGLSDSAHATINQNGMVWAAGALDGGEAVVFFPKGTRDPKNEKPVKPGTGWEALVSNAVIVPITSVGTDQMMPINPQLPAWLNSAIDMLPSKYRGLKGLRFIPQPFKTVSVVAGKPIMPEELDDLRTQPPSMDVYLAASLRIYDAVRALRPRAEELHGKSRPVTAMTTLEDGALWLAAAIEAVDNAVNPQPYPASDAFTPMQLVV